jgi:hypothetical protein
MHSECMQFSVSFYVFSECPQFHSSIPWTCPVQICWKISFLNSVYSAQAPFTSAYFMNTQRWIPYIGQRPPRATKGYHPIYSIAWTAAWRILLFLPFTAHYCAGGGSDSATKSPQLVAPPCTSGLYSTVLILSGWCTRVTKFCINMFELFDIIKFWFET